MERAAPN